MGEVELRIDRQRAVLRPHVGFGGSRRSMHLGYAQVLQHFRAGFKPHEGAFSLTRVPPAKQRRRP